MAEPDSILEHAPDAVTSAARSGQAMSYFQSQGWTQPQAAGIVGNLIHESALKTGARNAGDGSDGSDSIGLAQWNGDRAKNLQAFATSSGSNPNDFNTQLVFVQHELTGDHKAAGDAIRQAGNVRDATAAAVLGYERPAGAETGIAENTRGWATRLQNAEHLAGGSADLGSALPVVGGTLPLITTDNTGLGDGTPGSMSVPATSVKTPDDLWTPPADSDTEAKMAHREATEGLWQGTKDAFSYDGLTGQMWRAFHMPDFDPGATPYTMTKDDLEKHMAGLDPSYASWFSQAVTPAHANSIEAETRQHQTAMRGLAGLGWTGTGLRVAANVLDPSNIALGVATGGLGEAAIAGRAVGLLGRVAAQAAAGGVVSAGATAAMKATGLSDLQQDSIAKAALVGSLFGAGFGILGGPHTPVETNGMVAAARDGLAEMRSTATGTGRPMEAGAAYNPAAGPILGTGGGLDALKDADVARTAMGSGRFSVAADTGGNASPAVRALGGALFEDGVGKSDYSVNPHSAELELRTGLNSYGAEYARSYLPAVQAWAKDMGYGPWEYRQNIGDFEAQLADAVRGADDPMSVTQTPGYIQNLAQVIAKQSNQLRELANDPFSREGQVGRPVSGFGTLERDDSYLTRIWSPQKVGAYVEKNGMIALQQMLMRGVRAAQPTLNDGFVQRLADGFATNIYRRSVGAVDPKVARMFAVDDLDAFQRDLTETWGLPPDDAAAIRGELERSPDAGNDNRAKRRVLMDVNGTYSDGTAIKDLLVNDATFLHKAYTRHMLGKIALARVRILNPAYDAEAAATEAAVASRSAEGAISGGAGEGRGSDTGTDPSSRFLVSGITNDSDWSRALQSVRDGMANQRLGPQKIDAAMNALQYGYERIQGVPHPLANSSWAMAGRLINKFNILRLGSSFVFPHSGQIASMISQVGIRHLLSNVPAFKRIVSGDGEMLLRQVLPREAEQIWGAGVERMMARVEGSRWDHDLGVVPYQGRSNWYQSTDHALTTAGHAVMDWSGFSAMDGLMRRWTAHGIVGKFADLARKATRYVEAPYETRIKALRDQGYNLDAYHGTSAVFDRFDPEQLGSRTFAPSAGKGFFFSRKAETADAYTGRGPIDFDALPHDVRAKADALDLRHRALEDEASRLGALKDAAAQGTPAETFHAASGGDKASLEESVGMALPDRGPLGDVAAAVNGRSKAIAEEATRLSEERMALLEANRPYASGSNVRPALLKMENPLVHDFKGEGFRDRTYADLMDQAKAAGHDGVIFKNTTDGGPVDDIYAVFRPDQIQAKFADLPEMKIPQAEMDKIPPALLRRMKFWGLSNDDLATILTQIKQHSDTVPGSLFGGTKVNRLNLDAWDHQEAAVKFVNAVQRYASKIIQDNDIGALHRWMSHPMWRLFLQLRNFPVAAWDKRLLHNIHMRDGNALAYFMADTAVPAAIYAMQHSVASMGRDDRDDYLKKHLSVEALAKAGVERSSYASVFPIAAETLGTFSHLGQYQAEKPSDVLTNNTMTGTLNDALTAVGAVAKPMMQHRPMSQDEARAVGRMVSNHLLFSAVLNRMIQGRPKHAPVTYH